MCFKHNFQLLDHFSSAHQVECHSSTTTASKNLVRVYFYPEVSVGFLARSWDGLEISAQAQAPALSRLELLASIQAQICLSWSTSAFTLFVMNIKWKWPDREALQKDLNLSITTFYLPALIIKKNLGESRPRTTRPTLINNSDLLSFNQSSLAFNRTSSLKWFIDE